MQEEEKDPWEDQRIGSERAAKAKEATSPKRNQIHTRTMKNEEFCVPPSLTFHIPSFIPHPFISHPSSFLFASSSSITFFILYMTGQKAYSVLYNNTKHIWKYRRLSCTIVLTLTSRHRNTTTNRWRWLTPFNTVAAYYSTHTTAIADAGADEAEAEAELICCWLLAAGCSQYSYLYDTRAKYSYKVHVLRQSTHKVLWWRACWQDGGQSQATRQTVKQVTRMNLLVMGPGGGGIAHVIGGNGKAQFMLDDIALRTSTISYYSARARKLVRLLLHLILRDEKEKKKRKTMKLIT